MKKRKSKTKLIYWSEDAEKFARAIFNKDFFQIIDKIEMDEQELKYMLRSLEKFHKTFNEFDNKHRVDTMVKIILFARSLIYNVMMLKVDESFKIKIVRDSNKADDEYISQRRNEDHKENLDIDEYRAYL
jgi:hypothetical protein